MNRPVVFTDLDDTLFQTQRKCPEDMGRSIVMSTLEDGRSSGYASERQQRLTNWLRNGRLVPVTARSRKVLGRVDIEQAPAICANGGCIVGSDYEVDQQWHGHLKYQSLEIDSVRELHLLATCNLDKDAFRHWIVSENDLELYYVVKTNSEDLRTLDEAEERAREHLPDGWRIHRNGNNLAVLPPWLNKRNAVAYILSEMRRHDPHLPAIGIGDSHSDVGFMDLCDFAVTPTTSQVWKDIKLENQWCS